MVFSDSFSQIIQKDELNSRLICFFFFFYFKHMNRVLPCLENLAFYSYYLKQGPLSLVGVKCFMAQNSVGLPSTDASA